MKFFQLLIIAVIFIGCQNSQKTVKKDPMKTFFYVGTYTNKDSKGIYKYEVSKEGKLKKIGLVAKIENPSFLVKTKDNKTLLAVNEVDVDGSGFVSSFAIQKDSLLFINKSKTGGEHPCFITVNNTNDVLVANYTGGNVGLLKAEVSGKLSPLLNVQQHIGKGTTSRQKSAHAHSSWFHPTKNEVISVDLGTNELWFSKINSSKSEFTFSNQKTLKMTEGAGPRHLAFHPNNNWIYVLNELNNTVSLVKEKEGLYVLDNSISMLPDGYTEYSSGADIHISKDGKFLYASNRGHNSIVIYNINPENGNLISLGFESVKGINPRNFSLSPDNKFLLVANQETNNIVCFKRNDATGKLTFVSEISAPTPVCILF